MTAFVLKIIAVITMMVDHVGSIILSVNPHLIANNQDIYLYSRYIGRISFPIFAFLIANGCKHTSNINKYMLRLGLLAIISEVPYDLAFWGAGGGINFFRSTNIFYTLFLGVAAVAIYEKLKKVEMQWIFLALLAVFPIISLIISLPLFAAFDSLIIGIVLAAYSLAAFALANFLPEIKQSRKINVERKIIPALAIIPLFSLSGVLEADFHGIGVLLMFFLYLADPSDKVKRAIVLTLGLVYYYGRQFIPAYFMGAPPERFQFIALVLAFSLLSVVFIWFYNGKPGVNSKIVKWGFYAFYPVHIAVFAVISRFV